MKKLLLLLLLASCKRDRTCECTVTTTVPVQKANTYTKFESYCHCQATYTSSYYWKNQQTSTKVTTIYTNTTKHNAKNLCQGKHEDNGVNSVDYSDCKLQ